MPSFPLFESVPNVSEGRRPAILAGAADVIRAAGAALLDVHADAAHNRAVYTFAAAEPVIEAAALALVEYAVGAIDLRAHTGVHPRMGAVDVLPLVPLAGATMEEAVALSRRVGAEAARRFAMPVFLYAESATSPGRRRLEDIRRGQFEGLEAKLRRPEWAPDFGPHAPHPSAGAVAIGARPPLIAFNVNLASDRVDVARRIAAAVRERDGGLPFVKALGVAIEDGQTAQVSMNLTNFAVTPPAAALAAVEAEAARYGAAVRDSELVGLIPAAALPAAGGAALKIRDFRETQVLEHQLRQYLGA